MKNKIRFLAIHIQGESEIGVLGLGSLGHLSQDAAELHVRTLIEHKLPHALAQHFDAEVRVSEVVVTSLQPVTARALARLELDGGRFNQAVDLGETWLY